MISDFTEYLHNFRGFLGVIYGAVCIIELEVVKVSIVTEGARYVTLR
jgi:hypothetical protein